MAQRIVSLLPAATELICALGLRRRLVGRSAACDLPPAVHTLPALTLPASQPGAAGAAAPERGAQQLIAQQLAPVPVDAAALIGLQPDSIITHPRTDLPGFSLDELKRSANSLMVSRPELQLFHPTTLPEVYNAFQKLADTFGAGQQGKTLVQRMRRRAEQVAERARSSAARPRVLVIRQLAPLKGTGWWVPTLIETAGGTSLLAAAGQSPARLTWAAVAEADPDVLMLTLDATPAQMQTQLTGLLRDETIRSLRAYRSKRVIVVSGHDLFHRPGPRLIEALEVVAEVLHPQLFGIRRLGVLWNELF